MTGLRTVAIQALKPGHLTGCARLDPIPIAEHQNVGARHSAALQTPGQQRQQTAIRFVDLYAQIFCRPQVTLARVSTLEPVNRAAAAQSSLLKPRPKMPGTLATYQYSSRKSKVVALRSASVMIRTRLPTAS
jgi:hypothetical protein